MRTTGFTLIELLTVVIIIGVLTAIALPQYRRAMDRSKASEFLQMMPALFESRERWVEESQCYWRNGNMISCDEGAGSFNAKKLDIETKGVANAKTITTKNFTYNLVAKRIPGKDRAYISAKPTWGGSRGLTSATIYYDGRKFLCDDGNQAAKKPCDVLNIDDRAGS